MATGIVIATLEWGNRSEEYFIDSAIKNTKVLDQFTIIDNVKSKVQIPIFDGSITFGSDFCVFDPQSQTSIDEKEISVSNYKWAFQNCKTSLQTTYRSKMLKQGANNAETMDAQFAEWVYDFFAKKSGEKLVELAASQIVTEISADPEVINVTLTNSPTDKSTVLAAFEEVYLGLSQDLLDQLYGGADREYRPAFFVNSKVMQAYQLAIADKYTNTYEGIAEGNILPYLNMEVILFTTLADTEIIATNPANLILAVDDYADVEAIQAEYDAKISSDLLWGQFTVGFSYFKGENIVYGKI